MKQTNTRKKTETIVLSAVLTALVVILQFMGAFVRLGTFQCSLVLVPIVIGAAMCGVKISAWLGFVFGLVVLLNGDAALFFAWAPAATVITVLVKGIACGLCAGLVYKLFEKKIQYLAALLAAIVCPIVNTGIFAIGSFLFFFEDIAAWGAALGFGGGVETIFIGLIGGNFIFELVTNIVLTPVIVRIINFRKKK